MVNFDAMPMWLQRRLAGMLLARTGSWTKLERSLTKHAWEQANPKAQAAYLATLQAQLVAELTCINEVIVKVLS